MHNRPRAHWGKLRDAVRPPLLAELCRVFHAKDAAMLCALSHGQVSIDGWVIREEHLDRWTPEQLAGRMALLVGRQTRLYNASPRVRA